MKKSYVMAAACAALALTFAGCSTNAGSNAAIYFKNIQRILSTGSGSAQTSTATSSAASTAAATEIASPASFTVSGDTYTFSGVDNAAQYILYLCEKGSVKDDDDFSYSGVVTASGASEYTGSIRDLMNCAYGEYTAKVFAVAADYSMSAGVLADYSISGELPAPDLAYSYDGHGILSIQLANDDDYTSTVMPDEITVTVSGPVEQTVSFDESFSDFDVENLEEGDYTITAVAKSSSSWVTAPESETSELTITLGSEEIASDNYVKAQGGPGGGGGWEVKPVSLSIAEDETGFAFKIGDMDFFKTTAEKLDTPNEGCDYSYTLADGDENAPFECEMTLDLQSDGTAVLSVSAAGPISADRVYGTWVNDGGTISVTW